jgi:hypothetical protein
MTESVTETPEQIGLRSQVREALRSVADEMAASTTRVAIAVPVKQITNALMALLPRLADVPDYDHSLAEQRVWAAIPQAVDDTDPEFDDLDVIGPEVSVRAVGGEVVMVVTAPAIGRLEIPLTALDAREFFLSGVSAAQHARKVR